MKRLFVEMFLLSPEENIEIAKKLKTGVELFLKTHILVKLTTTRVKEWRAELSGVKGVSTHGPYRDLIPGSFDPLIRKVTLKRYLQAIEVTSMLEAEWMVIHLNFNEHLYGQLKARKQWVRNAIELFRELESKKVPIFLENTEEKNPDIFVDILNALDSKYFGMCFDVGHAYAFSDEDLSVWVEKLAPFIREVHLHESMKGEDNHLPLGSNYIDVNRVLKMLDEKASSDFVLTLEPRSEEDLGRNIDWLRNNGWIE